MGVKQIVKKAIALTKKKEIIAIPHVVEENRILDGKVAVILGGTGGLGKAIAKSLVESGCNVVLCGTNEEKLQRIANADFPSGGDDGSVKPLYFNVADFDAVEDNVKKTVKAFGRVDIVIYSAGVHTENVDFFSMTPGEFDRVMGVNIKGAFFVCQAFGKYMMENKIHGHMLLVSSSRGSEPAWSPYGLSKWALNGLTKGLAQMLLPYGITVNAIAPGSTATELLGVKEGDSIYAEDNIVNRLIMPDEVGNIAKMLVSSAGDMIAGEVVHVSAGRGCFDIR